MDGPTGSAFEARGEIAHFRRRRGDAEAAAIILEHVDTRPAVGRVDHHVDGPRRMKRVAQCTQARVGIGEMMQHTAADDVIEASPKLARTFDGKLLDFEIVEGMLAFQALREGDALGADIDAGHLGTWPAQCVMGSPESCRTPPQVCPDRRDRARPAREKESACRRRLSSQSRR